MHPPEDDSKPLDGGKETEHEKHERRQAELESRLIPGYQYNPMPNRAKRRAAAKRRGVFRIEGLWKHLNRDNENRQTIVKEKPQ